MKSGAPCQIWLGTAVRVQSVCFGIVAGSQDIRRIFLHRHPFGTDAGDELRAALFEFPAMVTRLVNRHVSIARLRDGQSDVWESAVLDKTLVIGKLS